MYLSSFPLIPLMAFQSVEPPLVVYLAGPSSSKFKTETCSSWKPACWHPTSFKPTWSHPTSWKPACWHPTSWKTSGQACLSGWKRFLEVGFVEARGHRRCVHASQKWHVQTTSPRGHGSEDECGVHRLPRSKTSVLYLKVRLVALTFCYCNTNHLVMFVVQLQPRLAAGLMSWRRPLQASVKTLLCSELRWWMFMATMPSRHWLLWRLVTLIIFVEEFYLLFYATTS